MKKVVSKVGKQLREYAELVKFEHTVFALPFALSAMLLALPIHVWPSIWTVLWVLCAMVGGRTYAMSLNRLLDAHFDAKNPRTSDRAIPAGRVSRTEGWFLALLSAAIFTLAAFQLPLICRLLLPVAFFILTLYSWMKRFSSLSHLVLGLALGSSAVGGWLAVTGQLSWLAVIFGMIVVFWVAGFDILYACQDYEFDKAGGLFSIPVALGLSGAFIASRISHLLTILLMILFGYLYGQTGHGIGYGYWLAVLITAGMLLYEHRLVSPQNLEKINQAFFEVNGRISLMVFGLIAFDKLWPG